MGKKAAEPPESSHFSTRPVARDDGLLAYATDREREMMLAYWETGNGDAAAEKCGVRGRRSIHYAFQRVRARAARSGYDPSTQHTRVVPPGYRLKGTSSLYVKGEKEPAVQWVKTTIDDERREEMLREMIAGFCEELPRLAPRPAPAASGRGGKGSTKRADGVNDLLAIYPVGDHHLGMYAWAEEAGADYDLDIGEKLLSGAFDFLTGAMPASEQAVVIFLGDLFHYDSMESVTPASKNLLDSDGRYAKMVRTCVRVVRRSIEATLARHEKVHVIVQPGNHDPSSSIMLGEAIHAIYENEPRVTVDRSPSPFHYYKHGLCLFGVCHGHEARKLEKLPLLMARDRPEDWGQTKHRYWYTGHVHSDRVIDVEGTRVESFRVLPPSDAWAHGKGYRSEREMKALVLHATHGETMRLSFRPEMLAA